MSSIWLLAIGVGMFLFGWFVYSKFVAYKVLRIDEKLVTPAHELRDDVDYVPTNKFVLWGHHFTAVAGAAPIVGPAIAVQWGWLPAFLWVTLGTVFFAGIHDMSALWASVRNKGKSIGTICTKMVSNRVGQLFMVVIFLLLLMVNAAFSIIIAKESAENPSTVIPAWGAIAIALVMGQLIYKKRMKLGLVTILGVVGLYLLVPLGVAVPVSLPNSVLGMGPVHQWVVILFIYAGIASVLPVWALLQPRDYVNGIQLFIALALLYLSILIVAPKVVAPTLIPAISQDGNWGLIFPLLFVTIACGAISGFHGLVSSGTTSKQINEFKDVRFVGYLGSVGEGSLALATIIACVAGVSLLSGFGTDVAAGDWTSIYKGGQRYFVEGGGAIIHEGFGLPQDVAQTLLSLMLVLFAATTMDAGVRLQRYIIQEWGEMYRIAWLRKTGLATLIAVLSSISLAWGGIVEQGSNQIVLWPIFGATNQLLAAMTLTILGVLLIKSNRVKGSLVMLIPMSFILLMSFWSACIKLIEFFRTSNWLLACVSLIVIVVTLLVMLSSLREISKVLKSRERKSAA